MTSTSCDRIFQPQAKMAGFLVILLFSCNPLQLEILTSYPHAVLAVVQMETPCNLNLSLASPSHVNLSLASPIGSVLTNSKEIFVSASQV